MDITDVETRACVISGALFIRTGRIELRSKLQANEVPEFQAMETEGDFFYVEKFTVLPDYQ